MKKTHSGEIISIGEIIDSVTCNVCGGEIKVIESFGIEPRDVFEHYLSINERWPDCLKITDNPKQKYKRGAKIYSLDICWDCFEKILKTCIIKPRVLEF